MVQIAKKSEISSMMEDVESIEMNGIKYVPVSFVSTELMNYVQELLLDRIGRIMMPDVDGLADYFEFNDACGLCLKELKSGINDVKSELNKTIE